VGVVHWYRRVIEKRGPFSRWGEGVTYEIAETNNCRIDKLGTKYPSEIPVSQGLMKLEIFQT
jgi:hypothetical protein